MPEARNPQPNLARWDVRRYWPAPVDATRIPGLDGVRAIAILLVLFAHVVDPAGTGKFLISPGELGLLGVQIFFVLSGFLITTLLLDEEQAHGGISLRGFYLRRAFRIFPAAYAFILVMLLLSIAGVLPMTGRDLAHAATYTVNYYSYEERSFQIGHLWSLAVEEQFYLLWPLALCLVRGRARVALILVVAIVCPVLRHLYETTFPELRILATESFETAADALAYGCLLALLRPWLHRYGVYTRCIAHWAMPLALAAGIFVLTQSAFAERVLGPVHHSALYIVVALFLDSAISQSRGVVRWAMNTRIAIYIGALSYSLYLWQQPFMNPHHDAWWSAQPQGLVFAIAAAMLSYYFIEKPFMNIRRRIESSQEARPKANAGLVAGLGGPPTQP